MGLEALKQYILVFHDAFPDIRFSVEEMIAESDFVVTLWMMTGTHKGELMGIPATSKKVKLSGVSLTRVSRGKIVENTTFWDSHTLMRQLGVKYFLRDHPSSPREYKSIRGGYSSFYLH